MKKMNLFYLLLTALLSFTFLSEALAAEKYPTREIEIVIPHEAGGSADIAIRFITDNLKKNLGVPIIVNNRTGANGAIGTSFVAKSKPDGYTIGGLSAADAVILPATTSNLPFKYSDLDPLCKFSQSPTAFFYKSDAPWKSLKDLVADAKKRPGQINWATLPTTVAYYQLEGFLKEAGINMNFIPLESNSQLITRVLGGNIDVGYTSLSPLVGQVKAGNLRVFFISNPERVSVLPQIPTLKENGYSNPIIYSFAGFFTPLGTPKPIRETLLKALEKSIKDPAVKPKLEEVSLALDYLSPEDFAKEIQESYAKVTEFVKSLKIPGSPK